MSESTTEQDAAKEEREVALRKAYGQATKELRSKFQSEFNNLYAKHAQALGQEWKPKPTAEEKAEQELTNLLAKYPELRDKV